MTNIENIGLKIKDQYFLKKYSKINELLEEVNQLELFEIYKRFIEDWKDMTAYILNKTNKENYDILSSDVSVIHFSLNSISEFQNLLDLVIKIKNVINE